MVFLTGVPDMPLLMGVMETIHLPFVSLILQVTLPDLAEQVPLFFFAAGAAEIAYVVFGAAEKVAWYATLELGGVVHLTPAGALGATVAVVGAGAGAAADCGAGVGAGSAALTVSDAAEQSKVRGLPPWLGICPG